MPGVRKPYGHRLPVAHDRRNPGDQQQRGLAIAVDLEVDLHNRKMIPYGPAALTPSTSNRRQRACTAAAVRDEILSGSAARQNALDLPRAA